MQRTIEYNTGILHHIDELLCQLTDAELAQPRALLFGSSIGGHLRHILEFYTCLLGRGRADHFSYDRRQRDPMIEREVIAARACIARSIGLLADTRGDMELLLLSELPGSTEEHIQRTTLARELTYLADHGVHHLAMVRIALDQELPHVRYPEELGVAASTRNHHARQAANA